MCNLCIKQKLPISLGWAWKAEADNCSQMIRAVETKAPPGNAFSSEASWLVNPDQDQGESSFPCKGRIQV